MRYIYIYRSPCPAANNRELLVGVVGAVCYVESIQSVGSSVGRVLTTKYISRIISREKIACMYTYIYGVVGAVGHVESIELSSQSGSTTTYGMRYLLSRTTQKVVYNFTTRQRQTAAISGLKLGSGTSRASIPGTK